MRRSELYKIERRVASLEKRAFLSIEGASKKFVSWLGKIFPNINVFRKVFRKYLPWVKTERDIEIFMKKSDKTAQSPKGREVLEILRGETKNPVEQVRILAEAIMVLETQKEDEAISKTSANIFVVNQVIKGVSRDADDRGQGILFLLGLTCFAMGLDAFKAGESLIQSILAGLTIPIVLLVFGLFVAGVPWLINKISELYARLKSKFTGGVEKNAFSVRKSSSENLRNIYARVAFLEYCHFRE